MRYSRGGIVAVLIAVEIFIAGAILSLLGGHGFPVYAAGMHHQGGKTFAPIDAGAAPHVVIDDANSGVSVSASTDGKIHVVDRSELMGLTWGGSSIAPLTVNRTADGVEIRRPAYDGARFAIIGFDREHIDVQVPAAALLEIQRCSGADVSGLNGEVRVHSVDGHIAASDVHASALTLASDDGSLRLNDVSAPSLNASTSDGSIRGRALRIGGGTLHTQDGSVRLELLDSNLTVHARTEDGNLYFNGNKTVSPDSDAVSSDFQIGSGGSPLEVSTQDGSIHITTNGAQ